VVARAKAMQTAAVLASIDDKAQVDRQKEWERRRLALHDQLVSEQGELSIQLAALPRKAAELLGREKEVQHQTNELRQEIEKEQASLGRLEEELNLRRERKAGRMRALKNSEAGLSELTADLLRMEKTLADLKAARQRQEQRFSLVPYAGRRGDNRKPIYIECTSKGIIFHPEHYQVNGFLAAPLEYRREIEARLAKFEDAQGKAEDRAYLLLLVRPDGITSYYQILAALQGAHVDFGYEFIDQDWVLDFTGESKRPWMVADTKENLSSQPAAAIKPKAVTGIRFGNLADEIPSSAEPLPANSKLATTNAGRSSTSSASGAGLTSSFRNESIQPNSPIGELSNASSKGVGGGNTFGSVAPGTMPNRSDGTAGPESLNGVGGYGGTPGSMVKGSIAGAPNGMSPSGSANGLGPNGGAFGSVSSSPTVNGSNGVALPESSMGVGGSGGTSGSTSSASAKNPNVGSGNGVSASGHAVSAPDSLPGLPATVGAENSTLMSRGLRGSSESFPNGSPASGAGNGSQAPGVAQESALPGQSPGGMAGVAPGGSPGAAGITAQNPTAGLSGDGAQQTSAAVSGQATPSPSPAATTSDVNIGRPVAIASGNPQPAQGAAGSVDQLPTPPSLLPPNAQTKSGGAITENPAGSATAGGPSTNGGIGGNTVGEESSGGPAVGSAALPTPFGSSQSRRRGGAKPEASPLILNRSRDWVITIDCRARALTIAGAEEPIPVTALSWAETENNPLLARIQRIIARRQATVAPGDIPYRPLIRFRVHSDGVRAYYLAYPALEPLQVPMSRENVDPDEDKAKRS
jgi:hypothetical protein